MKVRLAIGGVLCSVVLAATDARAGDPTKNQCAGASEAGQTLRHDGKLRAARVQLLVCAAKACPDVVRRDCVDHLNEVDAAIPTVVFTAKGAANVDLSNVVATMDGAPLADRLDGSALNVDPGPHTFVFTTAGYETVSTKLVIREGAKRRQEVISFALVKQPVAAGPSAAPVPPPPAESSPGDGQRMLAYVLGGVGVVGLGLGTYFGLRASSTYSDASSHCPTSSSCNEDGVSGGKAAHTQATVSTIAFAAGGAALAAGVVVFVTAPRHGGISVQPSAGVGVAGIRVGGGW